MTWARVAVFAGVALAVLAAVIVLPAAYANRNPDYSCSVDVLANANVDALGVDPDSLYVRGTWSWWPVGLTCELRGLDGDLIVIGPDPDYSALLIVGMLGAAGATSGALVGRRLASRIEGNRPPAGDAEMGET
ncbi:hypothetical protein GCM10025869_03340 [Homoserinibacter gongjuensis]|uniref:DUF3515 domain-containing protein n=1 Tax=Homoserinibacter gongjuensis TaxID=1162968 RepID=A0ABQ6JND6_9MICO|nr:hypothetical protein GCM10025869_03340 [Homoserinibacter gongjuensis]